MIGGRASASYGGAMTDISLDDNEAPAPAPTASAQSMTPFLPHQPQLIPEGHRRHVSVTTRLPHTTGPVALAAQTVIKSGPLKKRSKNLSGALWQQRYVVLEGAPTYVLVYYYAAAERADSAQKPRGVVSLKVRLAEFLSQCTPGCPCLAVVPALTLLSRPYAGSESRALWQRGPCISHQRSEAYLRIPRTEPRRREQLDREYQWRFRGGSHWIQW